MVTQIVRSSSEVRTRHHGYIFFHTLYKGCKVSFGNILFLIAIYLSRRRKVVTGKGVGCMSILGVCGSEYVCVSLIRSPLPARAKRMEWYNLCFLSLSLSLSISLSFLYLFLFYTKLPSDTLHRGYVETMRYLLV